MSTYRPILSEAARKNYSALTDILKRISYKPGWNIRIIEDPHLFGFVVEVIYDGYESNNAVFFPVVPESEQGTAVRERLGRSIGQTVRKPEKRYFRRSFDFYFLEHMEPDALVRYVIGETIKQAEMFEFDRWFKYYGDRVFGSEKDGK